MQAGYYRESNAELEEEGIRSLLRCRSEQKTGQQERIEQAEEGEGEIIRDSIQLLQVGSNQRIKGSKQRNKAELRKKKKNKNKKNKKNKRRLSAAPVCVLV
mgnify:CR=1 FL=1